MKSSETLPSAAYCLEPIIYLPVMTASTAAIEAILRYSGRILDPQKVYCWLRIKHNRRASEWESMLLFSQYARSIYYMDHKSTMLI
jgi:hypothetical protein